MTTEADPRAEAARRRTLAIISHPDAGKTTLTEKFLLYSGLLGADAGMVKAKGGQRSTASDWMELERRRGISITSTVMQFGYRGRVLNLLDTPGHRDFSEDTYRVLSATDSAIMVLDGAKGIESQTRKLFEVCRDREIPIITFVNKWDRPCRDPLELLDEIEDQLVLDPVPVTWPVGDGDRFAGVVDRRRRVFVRFTRTAHGSKAAPEEEIPMGRSDGAGDPGDSGGWGEAAGGLERIGGWAEARDELELLEGVGRTFDAKQFESGELTPVFYGSALTNFGVRLLLEAAADTAPAPAPRLDADDEPRPIDSDFSGIVFKVQANMDPAHRDRVAFVRVCSGRFRRGMTVTHGRTRKPFATKYALSVLGRDRQTLDEAWPGDVVGLVNAGDFRVGDAVYADEPVRWPPVPAFAPSHFRIARCLDPSRAKQFRAGIDQLDDEGIVQVLRDPEAGDRAPVLAAVGPLQFDVAQHRFEHELGAPVELAPGPWTTARATDAESARKLAPMTGVTVTRRSDGELVALFESPYWVERLEADHPELKLQRMIAEG